MSRLSDRVRRVVTPRRLRAMLVAGLSWLGLCHDAEAQAAPTAKGTAEKGTVDRAGIEGVLKKLDRAFAAADLEGYLATFAPDHPGAHALLGQRLQEVFSFGQALQRTSTILGEPRQVGPRTVVRVRAEIRAGGRDVAVAVEDTILAFRADDGTPVPTFAIETPRSSDCPSRDVFRCPPCNYEIGGVPGWLCVPMARERAQAIEGSSFYLLGTDLACDVSVRIEAMPRDAAPRTPTRVAEDLADALHQYEPAARKGLATEWLPAALAEAPIDGLRGARIEVRLPPTAAAPDGSVALFHVLEQGALEHLLLVRGSRAAADAHRAELDALLQSFHLLEPGLDPAAAADEPMRYHVGGWLDGASYVNEKRGVRLTGPAGWRAQQRCGGAAFRVLWQSDAGGRLWITGFTVPPGMKHWCRDTADRWLRQLCELAGLELPDDLGQWDEDPTCEAFARTVVCRDTNGPPGAIVERMLRVAFHEDLLVVVDGAGTSPAEWTAIEAALATLRL